MSRVNERKVARHVGKNIWIWERKMGDHMNFCFNFGIKVDFLKTYDATNTTARKEPIEIRPNIIVPCPMMMLCNVWNLPKTFSDTHI